MIKSYNYLCKYMIRIQVIPCTQRKVVLHLALHNCMNTSEKRRDFVPTFRA